MYEKLFQSSEEDLRSEVVNNLTKGKFDMFKSDLLDENEETNRQKKSSELRELIPV